MAAAATLAAGLAFGATAASADPSDPMQDDPDRVSDVWSDDGNKDVFRVAGTDRVATAIKLMNATEKRWGDTVIIARSDIFPDALAAGPLADVLDAPILVSKPGSELDSRVMDELEDSDFDRVILLGGTGVFTEDVREDLIDEGFEVERQRGVDRYETAVGIAKRVAKELADRHHVDGYTNKKSVNVYLATGTNFPDAMAAGAAAADNDGVVLLTKGSSMNSSTLDFLKKEWKRIPDFANGIEIHTVGRDAELAAKSSIDDIADTNTGKDRYHTAVLLASKFNHDPDTIAVASGENHADGVVAGGWVANHDGPLLLTKNKSLPTVVKNYLFGFADGDTDIVVVGGTGSVSRNVSDHIKDLFELLL
jgi:putative cell wall-binding protein